MSLCTWQSQIETVIIWVDKVLLAISNLSLVAILGTICWTVWSRYVMRSPVVWSEDVTSMSFAWFIFIGMAAVHNRRGHVGIDVFTSLLPKTAQAFVEHLGDVFMIVFCSYTAYLCTEQAIVSHATAHTTVLSIPLSYFFASLSIGFGLMALRSLSFVLGVPPILAKD